MSPKIQILETFPNISKIQHVEDDGCVWGTSGRKVFRNEGGKWTLFSKFPFNFPKDLFIFSRLATRALRLNKTNIFVNSNKKVIGIQGAKVYELKIGNPAKFLFEIQGDSVLHGSFAEDEAGWTYFGEYFRNPARGEVRGWRLSPDLSGWEIAYQFPEKSIRHVHGVFQDPFDKSALWLAVGDFKDECYIYKTNDRFGTLERYGDGSQIWRAVKLFFTEKTISWITDSNIGRNYACRMDRDSGELEKGQEIDAPGWYGTQTMEGDFFTFTTVEPGDGVLTDHSSILYSKDAFHWDKIHSFKKDPWRPMKIFKYGVIFCPSGMMSSESLYLSGEALTRFDGKSMRIELNK